MNPSLSVDLVSDFRQLTAFPFMVDALQAGTIVAVLAASVGWYAVLRRQIFASHTLSVMAFPGAAGAALIGLPVAVGYYVACATAGLAIAGTGRSPRRGYGGETALIGTVQTVGLAAGFLFLSLNQSILGGPETLLFGTFLGITQSQVLVLLAVALVSLIALAMIARPLLFATVERDIANASGVPVARLDLVFLLILALAIAATSQITGALLVFALLVAPPACAQQITLRPLAGLALSIVFGLLIAWLGLALAYFTIYPVGFYVTSLAFGLYVVIRAGRALKHPSEPLMFAYEFVRNAYLAGTFIALACGTLGWFVVLRGQVFAGDALSHVAFVGAIGAAAIGVNERIGLFLLTVALALAMGLLGRRAQADDVAIGTAFAWILGVGVLLLAVLATSAGGASGVTTANTLFGSIYSLSAGASVVAAAIAVVVTVAVLATTRPLLLSTLDPQLAALRGVPVRALGLGFLAALAIVTAESTEAVGALLLLGLIAAPAGAAAAITSRPLAGIAVSAAVAVGAMWGGLALSYAISGLPPSSAIIGLAAAAYGACATWGRLRQPRGRG